MATEELELEAAERHSPRSVKVFNPPRTACSLLSYLAIFAPPGVMLFIIHHYTVNLPLGDEWDTLFLVLSDRHGTLSFAKLWAQHNEHRMLLVNIVSVLTARFTNYNVVANVYCGFAFEVLALLLVWRILRITLRGGDAVMVRPLVIYASLVMFWSVATENWFWGISGLEFLSSVFWAIFVVWALAEWPGRWLGFALAFIGAIAAICTAAVGFPLLPVVGAGLVLSLRARKRQLVIQFAVFLILSVIFLAFFFKGWSPIFSFSAGQPLWKSTAQAVEYAFTYLGSPFQTRFVWKTSMAIGIAGVGWFVWCSWKAMIRAVEFESEIVPWLLLGLYGILNAALTGYGRRSLGLEQAVESTRYISIAETFWIALGVISGLRLRRWAAKPGRRRFVHAAPATVIVLFLLGYGISYYKAMARLRSVNQALRAGVHAVLHYRTATDADLKGLHPMPHTVREMSKRLENNHIGPFANVPANEYDSN